MSLKTPQEQESDYNQLKRRPIHKQDNDKKCCKDDPNNFSNKKLLHPCRSDDDEVDLNDKDDDEKIDDREIDECIPESSFQKANKTQKRNKVEGDAPIRIFTQYCNSSSYFRYTLLFIITILLILFVLYYLFVSKPATELSFKEKLNDMQIHFRDQNYLTFRILEKALDKVVNVTMEPSAPAIFTVVVNKNAIIKSHEFSHNLAKILAPHNTVFINESVSKHRNPDDIKLNIDDKIQSLARKKSLFVVVVDNLQNIPLKSAMIFHSYCDHEAAPIKQAVFLFIVPLNEILSKDASIKIIDKAAFRQLKNIWNEATPDEIDSLITRITVNVINIT